MFETFDKMMLAGLGALSMTREKAESIFDEYVSKGQLEREKKSGFINEMMGNAEKAKSELERIVSEQVSSTIKKLNIPAREDIDRIEKKLDQILEQK